MKKQWLAFGAILILGAQSAILSPTWARTSTKPATAPVLLNGFVQENTQLPREERAPAHREHLQDGALEPDHSEPGIVGLDLLIRPENFPQVKQIFPGSPAAIAGLKVGDTLLTVDGVTTLGKSSPQVDAQISDVPGTPIVFNYLRDGRVLRCKVVVAPLSSVAPAMRSVYFDVPGINR